MYPPLVLEVALVTFVACWLLYVASSGKAWVVAAVHGALATAASVYTLYVDDAELSRLSTAISAAYFAYDAICDMSFGERSIAFLIHHVVGVWTAHVCIQGPAYWALTYTWLQTNECSTPFLYAYKEMGYEWALWPFVLLFLISRVVINGYIICVDFAPNHFKDATVLCVLGLVYYGVQLYWFSRIVRMMLKVLRGEPKPEKKKKKA